MAKFEIAFENFSFLWIFQSGQVTHYNVTIWVGNPLQYTIWAGNPLQYTIWAGNPLQCDHLGR
jgi:hypothetical protein